MRKKRFAIILTALKIASTPSLSRSSSSSSSSSNGSPKLLTHRMRARQHSIALRALSIYLKRALLPWCVELLSWKPWKLTQNHKYFKQKSFSTGRLKIKVVLRASERERDAPAITTTYTHDGSTHSDGMLKLKDWPFCCMTSLLQFRHFFASLQTSKRGYTFRISYYENPE